MYLVTKLVSFLILLQGFDLFSQSIEYAKNIVNTLASEEYMGRGYTGKADLKSAEFIRKEFQSMGVQSLGKNFFQFFDLDVNTFPDKMEVKLNKKELLPGINYLIDSSSPSIKGIFKVIRIQKRDLLKPEKLKKVFESCIDKAILIDLNDTLKFSKEDEESFEKVLEAIKYDVNFKNSFTIIFSDKKLIWSTSDWQAKKAVITINSSGLDSEKITEIELNIESKYQRKYQSQNVIGLIKGNSIPDSFLVMTAHYDHLGIMGEKTFFPGANDNASGVAMMLNICKYFSANPPKYSLIFIAFSAEEAGLLGSQYFVQNPLFLIGKIKFLINFDLAGTGEEGIKVVNATIFPNEFEKLKQINSKNNYLSSVQPRGEACISDHCIFYNMKIPCFYIYTLGGISAYHDILDKPETLPLTEFKDYYQLILSFLNSF